MGPMGTIWAAKCLQFKTERWFNDKGDFVPQSPFKFAVFQGEMPLFLGNDMAFIEMKYVAETVISMFRLPPPVGSTAIIPKLIHILSSHMGGGFPVVVERRTNPSAALSVPA